MNFFTPTYMQWAKRHRDSGARYSLCASGMPVPLRSELGHPSLTLWEVDPYGPQFLRKELAALHDMPEASVLLGLGCTGINHTICAVLLEPDDLVMVESPAYQALTLLPSCFHAKTYALPRIPEEAYQVRLDSVTRHWRPGTRLLIISDPHNPTGAVLESSELVSLGRFLEREGAYAIVDEVYKGFLDDAPPAHVLHPRLISTSSFSKLYGLGALRVGWALAPESIVGRGFEYQDHAYIMIPGPCAELAQASWRRRDYFMLRARTTARENWRIVAQKLSEVSSVTFHPPDAGLCCLIKPHGAFDAPSFCDALVRERDTEIVPGDFFGAPGTLRVAFGADAETLGAGLDHLVTALNNRKK